MVDVLTASYNHENYIRDAIESVLKQKVNFKIRYIIGDDYSTDRTRDIIKEYQKKHPDLIFPIFQNKNLGAEENSKIIFNNVEAKYIALLDGDDYWKDSLKLQKQVDKLESDESYMITGHSVETIDEEGKKGIINIREGDFSFRDLMLGKNIPTLSLMFRHYKNCFEKEITKYPAGDFYIKSYMLNLGRGYLFNEPMGVYRIQGTGFWSTQKQSIVHKKTIKGYRNFLSSFPERRKDILYGTVKYKMKHKLFFSDFSIYVFSDLLTVLQIGIKKIYRKVWRTN